MRLNGVAGAIIKAQGYIVLASTHSHARGDVQLLTPECVTQDESFSAFMVCLGPCSSHEWLAQSKLPGASFLAELPAFMRSYHFAQWVPRDSEQAAAVEAPEALEVVGCD
jgi:hypothetical protein